jgi:hypothetical protein
MTIRHEGVLESVPENVKNMLLVMATNGVLRPDWKVCMGLWHGAAVPPLFWVAGFCPISPALLEWGLQMGKCYQI